MKCKICNNNMSFSGKVNGYVYPEVYNVYFCNNCNIQSIEIKEYNFKKLYDEIYKNKNITGYKRYWEYAEIIKYKKKPLDFLANNEAIYYSVYKTIKSYNCKSILEVGSGLGYLTYALNHEGYDCIGVDISNSAVNYSKKNFGNYYECDDIFNYLDKSENKFDIIIVNEVIEHLVDPQDFINKLFLKLHNGGKILFTTPNKSIFNLKTIWATDSPPVHLHWFSEETISILSNQIGFTYELVDFTDFYKKNLFIVNLDKANIKKDKNFIFNPDYTVKHVPNKKIENLLKFFKKILRKLYSFYLLKSQHNIFIGGKNGKTIAFVITK